MLIALIKVKSTVGVPSMSPAMRIRSEVWVMEKRAVAPCRLRDDACSPARRSGRDLRLGLAGCRGLVEGEARRMDHLGAGKEWDLHRKREGLFMLPPFMTKENTGLYRGSIDAIRSCMFWKIIRARSSARLSDSMTRREEMRFMLFFTRC